mmetsp:Transcript_32386/g.83963  ORF Transcript_32386/g.83963 Transcript_32386/m.83963 type:complete len:91 (+) Transcript_32386:135-407(+)
MLSFRNKAEGLAALELLQKFIGLKQNNSVRAANVLNSAALMSFIELNSDKLTFIEVTNTRSGEVEKIQFRVPDECKEHARTVAPSSKKAV